MNVFTLSKTLEFGEKTKGQWFSNDCDMVITGIPTEKPNSPLQKFKIWDINTGTNVRTVDNILKTQFEYNDNSFALNPRGTEFIGSSPTGSACWNTSTWEFTVWGFQQQGPQEIFYNRSGEVIYSETKIGYQHVVLIYDSETKKPIRSFQFFDEDVAYRALTPDITKYIYCGSNFLEDGNNNTSLKVRSVENGRLLLSIKDTTNGQIWGYTGIDVSHDGKRVVAGYDAELDENASETDGEYGYIQIWDIDTGESLIKKQTDINESPVFSPNGKLIVSGCYDGSIYIRDASTLEVITRFANPENDRSYSKIAFNDDGSKLIVVTAHRVKIWENRDWEAMKALDESMPAGMPVDIVSNIASYTGPSDVPDLVSIRNEKNLPLYSVPFAKDLFKKKERINGGRKTKKRRNKRQTKTKKHRKNKTKK
jgi:WD40 repeat protein